MNTQDERILVLVRRARAERSYYLGERIADFLVAAERTIKGLFAPAQPRPLKRAPMRVLHP